MARSVAVHPRSLKTVFVQAEDLDQWEFEHVFLENIIHAIKKRFPSFYDERDADQWPHREVRRIAGNGHAIVTVSEYLELVSICLVPKKHRDAFGWRDERRRVLAESWCCYVSRSFEDCIPYPVLCRVGTASNGASMYRRKDESIFDAEHYA